MKFLLVLLFAPTLLFASTEPKDSLSNSENEEIEWLTIEEALKRHQDEPRYWMIDVYTDWCGWCKRMDAATFSDSIITAELGDNYYAVKFDAESKEELTFGGKTYKFVPNGRRGHHELAAELMQGKMSYPTIVYLDNTASMIQPVPGYKTPEQLLPILQFISSESYKSVSWLDYQRDFDSPYETEKSE